jgi:predicted Zn-dependent protease
MGTLAAQMVGVDRKLDLFKVLNAIGPAGNVSTGDKVKIITDR